MSEPDSSELSDTSGDSRAARISLIVAMARNRVIGRGNTIPWRLPSELALFKSLTMGHHIVMGRKTYESIGRLLPGRTTVIVTRDRQYQIASAKIAHSLADAIAQCAGDDEIFVIGGAELFKFALPIADRIYLTVIDADIPGDTLMPGFNLADWKQTSTQRYAADEKNLYDYTFSVFERARVYSESRD